MHQALQGDGKPPDEVAIVEPAATDPVAEPVESDISTDKEPVKEADVPYGRFKETIDQKNTAQQEAKQLREENARLVTDLTDMAKAVAGGDRITKTEKADAKEDIASLVKQGIIAQADADQFMRVLNAARPSREPVDSEKTKELETTLKAATEEIKGLKNVIYGEKDSQEKASALKKFEGIVDAPKLTEKLSEMMNSKDPTRRYLAEHGTYTDIIKHEFSEEILQAEVDKVVKGKVTPAPKIDPSKGKGGPKKPDSKDIEYDPSNPRAADIALKAKLRSQMSSAE